MVKRDGEAPDRPDWMSSQEAASHLGITVRTLYRLIDDGKLTAYRMGRVIRLQRPDVLTYLESSRIQPGELTHLYPEPAGPDG